MRSPDRVVFATRASRLALTQTRLVTDRLAAAHPGLDIQILEVSTQGDRDARPFAEIGGKGLFTSEVERAVIEGRADLAIHSAKDLTAELGPGCEILCVPARAGRADVVLGGEGENGRARLLSLVAGASVGTSSMRRRALLAELRGDVHAVEFRGNLDTRVNKVASGVVDAAIVAAAGLERLGSDAADRAELDPEWWVPAPGQGILAVEGLSERDDLRQLLEPLLDDDAATELAAERAFADRLEGGCSVPLGCSAVATEGRVEVWGYLGSPGAPGVRHRGAGSSKDAAQVGREVAEAILAAGGRAILDGLDAIESPTVEEP